jgi:uncharacterized protein YbjT (DUF2867 family)
MKRIFITGATGTVGCEVIKAIKALDYPVQIKAGVREITKKQSLYADHDLQFVKFDYTNFATFTPALFECDTLFLVRPPQISNVPKYFYPLIEVAKKIGIQHIIFISVQGVEENPGIPHFKIEKCIVDSKIPFTFLRPAYFMQNFLTTLKSELINKKRIFLPAGITRFTMIDVEDIGRVAAKVLESPEKHLNKCYDLTCDEKLNFKEIAEKFSKLLGSTIKYISPNLLRFYLTQRWNKLSTRYILVLILLHYFPRFQKEPTTSQCVSNITLQPAGTFDAFLEKNKFQWL